MGLHAAHPAYAAAHWLQHGCGLFNGYPNQTFAGHRTLTRYEFSVATQRMIVSLGNFRQAPPAPAPVKRPPAQPGPHGPTSVSGPPGPPGPPPELVALSRDPDRQRAAAIWLRALVDTFDTELALLGGNSSQYRVQLDSWRNPLPPQRTAPAKKQPGTRAAVDGGQPKHRVFQDVPLADPDYAAINYLSRECGAFTGYPTRTFGVRRHLTRYEFAVAIQRMVADVRNAHADRSSGRNVPHARVTLAQLAEPPGPIRPDAESRRLLRETLRDPERRRDLGIWLATLIDLYDDELALLGARVGDLRQQLAPLLMKTEPAQETGK